MALGLRNQFALTLCLVTLISTLILSIILISLTRRDLTTLTNDNLAILEQNYRLQVETGLLAQSQHLAETLINPLYFEDFTAITELLAAHTSGPQPINAFLLDMRGEILNDGTEFFGRLGEPYIALSLLEQELLQQGQSLLIEDTAVLKAISPVRLANKAIGVAMIESPLEQLFAGYADARERILETSSRQVRFYMMLSVGVLMVLLSLIWLLAQRIAKKLYDPVMELRDHAVALGRGDNQSFSRLHRQDELGELAQAIYSLASDLQLQNQSVRFLAFHDPLTGLLNRTGFQSKMEEEFAVLAATGQKGALLFIDIDDFKEVNDSLGHEAGDRALRAISDRLRKNLNAGEKNPGNVRHLARIGGDEFTLFVAPVADDAEVILIAEDILSALSMPVVAEHERIHVSASIGMANFPDDGENVSTLLNNADAAMYTSKHLGKGTYRYYEPDMNSALFRSSTIKIEFQKALRSNDQLDLLFQPIIDLNSNKIVALEALIRWHHPRLGYLSPEQFIAIVEHSEVALATDLWVLTKSLNLLEDLNAAAHENISVSVNISASNLVRKQFSSAVAKLIKHRENLAARIKLEITETFLHSDDEQARTSMDELRGMGFEIWLDDFGTGYSSLRHLKEFPVNGFKIDKSFISSLMESVSNRKMVTAMLALADAFNVGLVAEGIDQAETREFLQELGAVYGQGMLLGDPLNRRILFDALDKNKKGRGISLSGNSNILPF